MMRFMFILPMPPLMPLIAFCMVIGDFSESLPNGASLTGLASGKWEI
jgi:hypothetical protein